jgi:hypothetical protein
MAAELDNDPRIPTLTDVVKQGNPSLMFNLKPPPSASNEHLVEDEDIAEAEEQIAHNEVIELDVYEKEVQDEMFQVTGHPDDSDLVIQETHLEEFTHTAEGSAVIAQPEEQEEPQSTPETPKSSFSLDALGLPFDFFSKVTRSEPKDSGEAEASQTTETPELDDTQSVSTPPEASAAEPADTYPDLDVESVLMALEVPVSEILQRHLETARDEIHSLIREQLERHHQD